jgi:hypothetical protein
MSESNDPCIVCGQPIEPAYLPGWRCENCYAFAMRDSSGVNVIAVAIARELADE